MNTPPNEPAGNHPFAAWLRKLVRYVRASEIKPGIGYRVNRTPTGTILEISIKSIAGGGTVNVQVCDPDTGELKYFELVGREREAPPEQE